MSVVAIQEQLINSHNSQLRRSLSSQPSTSLTLSYTYTLIGPKTTGLLHNLDNLAAHQLNSITEVIETLGVYDFCAALQIIYKDIPACDKNTNNFTMAMRFGVFIVICLFMFIFRRFVVMVLFALSILTVSADSVTCETIGRCKPCMKKELVGKASCLYLLNCG